MSTAARTLFGRSARQVTSWAAFGTAGLALTATWAAGVANTSGSSGAAVPSAAIVAGAPSGADDRFDGAVAAGADASLPIEFTGLWGRIPADAGGAGDPTGYELFDVDLAGLTDGTYFVEVGLLPTAPPAGFTALQVEWVIDDQPCATADLATSAGTPANVQVHFADNLDNSVVFSGLEEGTTHCIGVLATDPSLASDPSATFVRRGSSGAFAGTMPTFVAIVNEHT